MLQVGRSPGPFLMRSFDYSIDLILATSLGHEVYSASDRNEYQKQKNHVS
jgi:hypothetical protein